MIAKVEQLTAPLLEAAGEAVTAIVSYEGDAHTGVYLRDDVKSRFTEAENEEIRKEFLLAALSDPATNPDSSHFGSLDFTIRCFRNEFVAHVPTGEWSGLLVGFDRAEVEDANKLLSWLTSLQDRIIAHTDDA